jgi:hypothetical protein
MKTEFMNSSKLQIIAISLLLIGFIFVVANFVSPHVVLVKIAHQTSNTVFHPIASVNQTYLNGNLFNPPLQPSAIVYHNFSAINRTSGQTLAISWYSDIFLGGFIFTEKQFANFQSIIPNIKDNGTTLTAQEWASRNGITYEAAE